MDAHLLLVGIGPVQSFIAAARRCHDLWYGSWLLANLTRDAARAIEVECGGDALVFPKARGNDPGVANKILAVVSDPQRAAEAGRRAVHTTLERLATELVQHDRLRDNPGFAADTARLQILDMAEYVWVSVTLGDPGYDAARREAERLFACRKSTRNWSQPPWPVRAGLPKSSLDGLRESVISARLPALRPGEKLCGPGLLKRVVLPSTRQTPAFHSTSHVAAGPLLLRIARLGSQATDAVTRYFATLEGLLGPAFDDFEIRAGSRLATACFASPFGSQQIVTGVPRAFDQDGRRGVDGALFFGGRLDEAFGRERCPERDQARAARAACLGALGLGRREPTPYYALLAADGDHMGRAIDSRRDRAAHTRIAVELASFARSCRDRIESRGGSLIYSGGDDILALVPLHGALRCAKELHEDFDQLVGRMSESPEADRAMFAEDCRPTLSVGIAIVHHLEDLALARRRVLAAEALAKRERDSLGLILAPRSGAEIRLAARWREDPCGRIDRWCRWLHEERLPDSVAFELESSLGMLGPLDVPGTMPAALDAGLVRALLRRSLGRRQAKRGNDALDDEVAHELSQRLPATGDLGQVISAARSLADEVQVARMFLAAYDDAWGGGS